VVRHNGAETSTLEQGIPSWSYDLPCGYVGERAKHSAVFFWPAYTNVKVTVHITRQQ